MKHQVLFSALLLISGSFLACSESRSPTAPLSAPSTPLALFGEVHSAQEGLPIRDVRVSIEGYGFALTDRSGRYRFEMRIPEGTYTVSAKVEGFREGRATVNLGREPVGKNFELSETDLPEYFLVGTVWFSGAEGQRAHQIAKVEILDGPHAGLSTHLDEGHYGFHDLAGGTIQVRASTGDLSQTRTVELAGPRTTIRADFSL